MILIEKQCASCHKIYQSRKECNYCSIKCAGNAKKIRIQISCKGCNIFFETTPSKVKFGKKYCSQDCYENFGRSHDCKEYFYRHILQKENSECLEWHGSLNSSGYGIISVKGRNIPAHRFSYELHSTAKIPANMFVCHKCDNKKCCNFEHLWLGTCADNNKDRDLKGRNNQSKGSKNGQAKLSEWQVKEIKQKLQIPGIFDTTIAKEYGVTSRIIGGIRKGMMWKHVK